MSETIQIIGSPLSPYVRKVLACLEHKGLAWQIDPVVPFFGDDAFSKLSPVRRIPVMIDGDLTLADSTAICEYLDDRYAEPRLRPADVRDRARARWLEEFADTRIGDVLIWRLFNQVVIKPAVWGEAADEQLLARALNEEIPQILDYLESVVRDSQAAESSFLFGPVSIADIAIAAFFRNAAFARYRIDANRWPTSAAFVDRVLALPCFAKLIRIEETIRRLPIPQHRDAIAQLGVSLTARSYATSTPRRGVMRTE
jgi:glutathione S-transferase